MSDQEIKYQKMKAGNKEWLLNGLTLLLLFLLVFVFLYIISPVIEKIFYD
ncbi:MAG TPA: hypothetical protein VJY62_15515 [Bacteroidia bacterium]|nr:hypothetical protein [Bacteroidia bacterium]